MGYYSHVGIFRFTTHAATGRSFLKCQWAASNELGRLSFVRDTFVLFTRYFLGAQTLVQAALAPALEELAQPPTLPIGTKESSDKQDPLTDYLVGAAVPRLVDIGPDPWLEPVDVTPPLQGGEGYRDMGGLSVELELFSGGEKVFDLMFKLVHYFAGFSSGGEQTSYAKRHPGYSLFDLEDEQSDHTLKNLKAPLEKIYLLPDDRPGFPTSYGGRYKKSKNFSAKDLIPWGFMYYSEGG